MGFTNKTPHFDLGQYVGSDIPSYLTDWNDTMSEIDTALYTNQQNATAQGTRLSTVEAAQALDAANIATLQENVTKAQTDITAEGESRTAADAALSARVLVTEQEIATNTQNIATNTQNIDKVLPYSGLRYVNPTDTLTLTVSADSILNSGSLSDSNQGTADGNILVTIQFYNNVGGYVYNVDTDEITLALSYRAYIRGSGYINATSSTARTRMAILNVNVPIENGVTALTEYILAGKLYYNGGVVDLSNKSISNLSLATPAIQGFYPGSNNYLCHTWEIYKYTGSSDLMLTGYAANHLDTADNSAHHIDLVHTTATTFNYVYSTMNMVISA